MKKILTIFVCAITFSALYADSARPEILDRIRDYDLRHTDLLVKVVRDSETLRYAKVRALEKMAVLYKQSPKDAELVSPKFLEGIQQGLLHPAPDVREAACKAVFVFNESQMAPHLVLAVTKKLQDETMPSVVFACAHSLRVFTKESETTLIAPALIAQVNRYLANFQNDNKNEKALREICLTLAVVKERKSFIPLLKVLQSRYDDSVKEAAQEALQAIRVPDKK
ncbi:MAG: hypothetical protein LDLANPLL_00483 [Turneriella sp.]|nr:hypothetical protein [Turneriella sp.]